MIFKVNRLIFRRTYYNIFLHHTEPPPPNRILYPLENRKLLQVCGTDAAVFLQGLITNDMRHFDDGAKSMYAMFLNNKGRVLYDTLILKSNDDKDGLSYLIECDKSVAGLLQRHLKMFKLKRKVEIGDASPQLKLWAFISDSNSTNLVGPPKQGISLYKDPRLSNLGYRILTPVTTKEDEILNFVGDDVVVSPNDTGYKYLRYRLGVSEGAEDLPPGTSFPLEANCDYLHGVSFHKGCYIGQEVTARVHHTGVIRKRIMPIRFKEDVKDLQLDSTISVSGNPKSNVGKLKKYHDDCGLGLVRIKEAMEANSLSVGTYPIEVVKPEWWPVEAPKEKSSVPKQEET